MNIDSGDTLLVPGTEGPVCRERQAGVVPPGFASTLRKNSAEGRAPCPIGA